MGEATATRSATQVAREFAEAYNAGNYERCAALMTDGVVEREINPSGYIEFRGREAIIEEARDFLSRSESLDVLELTVEPAGPLVRVINRWKIVREGRPFLCDFYELFRIEDGQVAQIDLVCSGVVELTT
jgi:ketosteroid isomerase-like protein